ncbi:MAG: site-specific integrase, partial [Planctomycetaceae bacterium]
MPRKPVPSYRLHKASGQTRTIISGRHIYRGKYGSPESRQRSARILAEATLPAGAPTPQVAADSQRLLVSELLVAYLKFAETYYSSEGQPT